MRTTTLAAFCLLLGSYSANAETVLRLSSWLPANHPVVTQALQPWAKSVEEATGGNVRVQIVDTRDSKDSQYDLLSQGKVDIAYAPHDYTPEYFSAYPLVQLPLLTPSAEAMSVAYWRTQQKFQTSEEYRNMHLLTLFTHGPGQFWNSKRSIQRFEDLDGLKLRVPGGAISRMLRNMGVVSIQAPAAGAQALLSSGVADGVVFPLELVHSFGLEPQLRYGSTVEGGFYNASFYMAVNQQTWNKLSPAERSAIEKLSGEGLARTIGRAWDQGDRQSVQQLRQAGVQIEEIGKDLHQELEQRSRKVRVQVLEQVRSRGVDGESFLNELEAQIKAQGHT